MQINAKEKLIQLFSTKNLKKDANSKGYWKP